VAIAENPCPLSIMMSMLERFYSKEQSENLKSNILAPFIKEVAKDFPKKGYTDLYVKHLLRNMEIFGDWLKTKSIPLDQVVLNHVEEFASHLCMNRSRTLAPPKKGKPFGTKRIAARLAVSMIRKVYHPLPRSFQLELYYTKKHAEKLKANYLAPFMEETAEDFRGKGFCDQYAKEILYGMSVFGDWLKENNVSLALVDQNHVDEFISDLFVQRAAVNKIRINGKLFETKRIAARLAVTMIHRIYPRPKTAFEIFYKNDHVEKLRRNYLAPFMEETAKDFHEKGYFALYVRQILHGMSVFGDWLKTKGIALENVVQDHVDEFNSDLLAGRTKSYNAKRQSKQFESKRTAARLAISLIHRVYPPTKTAIQLEVQRHVDHLRYDHGFRELTIDFHQKWLLDFLYKLHGNEKPCVQTLTPVQVRNYIESLPHFDSGYKNKQQISAVLRKYFRFLELNGASVTHLSSAIPKFPCNRRSLSPNIVSKDEFETLLESVDRSTPLGKRTYASILCLGCLGMRIGDINRVTLDDINWREGTIRVCNQKVGSPFHLPLPQRLGAALADYIQNGRPHSHSRQIFLNHACAHFTGLTTTSSTLRNRVALYWDKSGLSDRFSGTHVLRHSLATALRQKGIPLKTIADVLGHGVIQSTALYAQVDLPALRQVAQPWPNGGDD